jgi:hypothetical protein
MASTITAGNATNGLALSCDNTGILELKTGTGAGTTAMTIGTGQQVAVTLGSAAAPAITFSGDTNTGIFSPAADTIAFSEGGVESMRIDASGNVGIGTSSPITRLHVLASLTGGQFIVANSETNSSTKYGSFGTQHYTNTEEPALCIAMESASTENNVLIGGALGTFNAATTIKFYTAANNTTVGGTERARITSSGDFLVGKTSADGTSAGCELRASGVGVFVRDSNTPLGINRRTNDGGLISFQQDGTEEGSISVSGTTVSYNGGHLSRWSQTADNTRIELLKGTVMSNLDQMAEWIDPETGEPQANEQLNCMKVSDVEGDVNVAGVFVNWDNDDDVFANDMNVAMTGDMIIRIAQGVTVQRGDLLMSAGDGTAKPQGDDIIRSKTVAKVTSTHVTCTYEDGSYCVPCVLMAC